MSMLRFVVSGKGKKKDEDEKKEEKKTKQTPAAKPRHFLHSWTINREWLCYENGMMYCKTCREENTQQSKSNPPKSNTFIAGSTNFKLEAVKDHELSKAHRVACTSRSNRMKPRQETPAGKALSTLTLAQASRVRILLLNTYAIMKNARPFSDLEWMCRYGFLHTKVQSYPNVERKQTQLDFLLVFRACFFLIIYLCQPLIS